MVASSLITITINDYYNKNQQQTKIMFSVSRITLLTDPLPVSVTKLQS